MKPFTAFGGLTLTCIAWDGRILAADKMSSFGGVGVKTTKLHLFPEQRIALGCSGNTSRIREFVEWVRAGRVPNDLPAWQRNVSDSIEAMLIEDGVPHLYGEGAIAVKIDEPFFAIGSGRDFAIAAMALGKSAIEAVELASRCCLSCGKGVDWAQCASDPVKVWTWPPAMRFPDLDHDLAKAYPPAAFRSVATGSASRSRSGWRCSS